MTAESIRTTVSVTLDKTEAGFTITAVHLQVTAKIPGANQQAFETVANNAKAGCPVFDRLAELGDVPRADDVFCCLGTTMKHAGSEAAFRRVDFTYVHELAQLASRQRAGQFLLVSALGADRQSRVFYNRVKGEVEEAVRKLPFDGVHIFRPSLLLGERRESRPGERLAILAGRALGFMFVGPLGRYRPIAARVVAAAMIRIAKDAARGVHVYESDRIRGLAAS